MGTKGRVWVTIGTHKCDAKSLMDFKFATVPSSSGFKRSYLLSSSDSPDMQVPHLSSGLSVRSQDICIFSIMGNGVDWSHHLPMQSTGKILLTQKHTGK